MTRDEIKRVLGYVRVSTDEQGRSGLGLEAQRAAIAAACASRGWELVAILEDVASGKTTNGRARLRQARQLLAERGADALVVARLDRLSRSLLDFAAIVDEAKRRQWLLIVLDGDFDMSTPTGKAMAGMLATFAEFERELISQRIREAMAAKKARGERVGAERKISPQIEARIVRSRKRGASFEAIAERLTRDGIPTPSGGESWSWRTVQKVARRHLEEPVTPRRRREEAS